MVGKIKVTRTQLKILNREMARYDLHFKKVKEKGKSPSCCTANEFKEAVRSKETSEVAFSNLGSKDRDQVGVGKRDGVTRSKM